MIKVVDGKQEIRVLVKPADYENAVQTILVPEG
jgi:hypothetical protein